MKLVAEEYANKILNYDYTPSKSKQTKKYKSFVECFISGYNANIIKIYK